MPRYLIKKQVDVPLGGVEVDGLTYLERYIKMTEAVEITDENPLPADVKAAMLKRVGEHMSEYYSRPDAPPPPACFKPCPKGE